MKTIQSCRAVILFFLVPALFLLFYISPARAAWTIESSVPTTEQFRAVWGYSDNRVVAAGNYGTLLLYDGTRWQDVSGITEKNIFGVWWASENEAFAVCDKGALLHFDGTTWTAMNSGTTQRLREIWGTSGTDVFAVGE
ncbi:MAG: WD40 repeat domain-containing protein, partial [Pseudomonadota bacterium]